MLPSEWEAGQRNPNGGTNGGTKRCNCAVSRGSQGYGVGVRFPPATNNDSRTSQNVPSSPETPASINDLGDFFARDVLKAST